MDANPKNFKTPIALLQNQGGSKIRVFTIEWIDGSVWVGAE